jgi:hypothetical protein
MHARPMVILLGVLLGSARMAAAQPTLPEVLPKEFVCMIQAAKAQATLVDKDSKCVAKCWTTFWKGIGTEDDCTWPYGGLAASCMQHYAIEAKAELTILKKCVTGPGADCPECYDDSAGDCMAAALVNLFTIHFSGLESPVFCEGTGAAPAEQKCQVGTSKSVAKYVRSSAKCYRRCFDDARSGGDVTTCLPPETDPELLACLATAGTKIAAYIDKGCLVDAPDCTPAYPTGAQWVQQIHAELQSFIPGLYCGSPSGAFLD